VNRRSQTAALCFLCLLSAATTRAAASTSALDRLADDGKYIVDNLQLDLRDIATSPLHIADAATGVGIAYQW